MALSYMAADPRTVADALLEIVTNLENTARRIGDDGRLTLEGKAETWVSAVAAARPAYDKALADLESVKRGLDAAEGYARAEITPPITGAPTASDEATCARLVGRGKPDAAALAAMVKDLEGTTALTLTLGEIAARGLASRDTIGQVIEAESETFAAYRRDYAAPVAKASGLIARMIDRAPVALDYDAARSGEATRYWVGLEAARLPDPFGVDLDGKIYTDGNAVPDALNGAR